MISSLSASSASYATQSTQAPKGPPPPPPRPEGTEGGVNENFETALTEAAAKVGLSDEELATLKAEIQSAIDGLGQTNDPGSVGETVDQVLEQFGIDSEEFKEALGEPPHGNRPPPPNAGGYGRGDSESSTGFGIFSSLYAVDLEA